MLSLLYHFLDELLFLFCAEPFFIGKVRIGFYVLFQGLIEYCALIFIATHSIFFYQGN